MITELPIFLVVEHLKRLTSAQVPRDEADQEMQMFEIALSGDREEEQRDRSAREDLGLLRAYLGLRLGDLDSLPPQAHLWFLERLCLDPEAMREGDARALRDIYFLSPHDVRRYLAVSALLTLDARSESNASLVRIIAEAIIKDEALAEPEKVSEVRELTEILLDLFSAEEPAGRRALVFLAGFEREGFLREGHPVASAIVSRAQLLGGRDGDVLLKILDRPRER
ncbi:MAG TPA: hypothetical protein VGG03_06415 [Thermoanaerobaculia bacterium]|jgi:hypothetical protein